MIYAAQYEIPAKDFARLPLPNMQPLALPECLREVLELNPLPDNITLAIHCDGSLPQVLAIDFCHRHIKFIAQTVAQTLHHVTLVFQRMGVFQAQLQRQYTD